MPRDFLGTALAYPIRPDGAGGLKTVSGLDAVDASIRAIIESLLGSHLFEPWLGLPSFVFQPQAEPALITQWIKTAIINGDDRVDAENIQVFYPGSDSDFDLGLFNVTVQYAVKGTADGRTLTLPYRAPNFSTGL